MKPFINLMIATSVLFSMSACQTDHSHNKIDNKMSNNPLLQTWDTPYQTPPFSKIKESDYEPAFKAAIKEQNEAIEAIISNTKTPNFKNTIEAYEHSGDLLDRISSLFFNLNSANTNSEMDKVAEIITPLITEHEDNLKLNQALFERVKTVYDNQDQETLTQEQTVLLKKLYRSFVRGGALLNEKEQEKLRAINTRLADLSLKFKNNVLAETNAFQLFINQKEDLDGLPESVIESAALEAKEAGKEGQWLFTLHYPSIWPFMQNSTRRDLRQKMHQAYINRGNNNNANDNKAILKEMVNLRVEKAHLLGFKNYASYILDVNTAKTPEKAGKLLNQLMTAALANAKEEVKDLQAIIDKQGETFSLQHWDWWYYANQLKQQKYALDDEILRPYFQLEKVRNGAFDVAHKLYGLSFKEVNNIDKYHSDVATFEVYDKDQSLLGILYTDWHPRASKGAGAWMTSFREQSKKGGKRVVPQIMMVCNFSKPTESTPSLLTLDEVETLFHEFGHVLHGLLSNTTYASLAGTSVARDFVELPSQLMENWVAEPEVLKSFAQHYQTGETIPDSLLQKMDKASKFNQGFATVEYLAAAILDMDWHTINETQDELDVNAFETASLNKMGLIPEIIVRYRSPYFSHIFEGGYAAGYYGYIWSAILDADVFDSFKENGLFDPATAQALRDKLLSKGGTEDEMTMFINFKGKEPNIEPLLEKRGLKTTSQQE